MSRSLRSNDHLIAAGAFGKDWIKDDYWKDTKGGFNPEVFADLDPVTRQRLSDYRVGPRVLKGDEESRGAVNYQTNSWSDTKPDKSNFMLNLMQGYLGDDDYDDTVKRSTNRGRVQNAVWEMGLPHIKTSEHLTQFLDRTDALIAKHGNFLKDGWDPKDIMLYREAPQQAVATAAPVETTVDVPKVVKKKPVPKEPIEGVDYMTSNMENTYDRMQDYDNRMQDYNIGSKAEDWIAGAFESDRDQQQHAQGLADTYKFEINKQLKEQEEADKISTAVGNTLGVFSGYSV